MTTAPEPNAHLDHQAAVAAKAEAYRWEPTSGAMGPNFVLMLGDTYPFGGIHVYVEGDDPNQEAALRAFLNGLKDLSR